jgi:hypothetical protein
LLKKLLRNEKISEDSKKNFRSHEVKAEISDFKIMAGMSGYIQD